MRIIQDTKYNDKRVFNQKAGKRLNKLSKTRKNARDLKADINAKRPKTQNTHDKALSLQKMEKEVSVLMRGLLPKLVKT